MCYNLLAASGGAYARNVEPERHRPMAADELAQVPGRFERVDVGQPFTVIVDYAHTDDALRNLTAVARDFLAQRGGRDASSRYSDAAAIATAASVR